MMKPANCRAWQGFPGNHQAIAGISDCALKKLFMEQA
jgi:hypothetical protein